MWSDSRVTMSGGSITGNTATRGVGGVLAAKGAVFTWQGGTISGNKAPATTRVDTWNILRMDGTSSSSSGSSSSGSPSYQSSDPSADFGFTSHLNLYFQGWHQNLVSFGIPLQLGVELKLPVVTLDLLGEASAGIGYGNLFEYHLGGMAEIYFFRSIGLGAGMGFYGSAFNIGSTIGSADESAVSYEPPIKTIYYHFALIFRDDSKTSLYAERYGDGRWGFGLMWGWVLSD
jgi:hypothetical protein